MSQTNSDGKTVTERIESIGQLSVGDKIVFERRSLDDADIERKRPLTVVDGATRTVANDHHDPQAGCVAFETQQHAIEARGDCVRFPSRGSGEDLTDDVQGVRHTDD